MIMGRQIGPRWLASGLILAIALLTASCVGVTQSFTEPATVTPVPADEPAERRDSRGEPGNAAAGATARPNELETATSASSTIVPSGTPEPEPSAAALQPGENWLTYVNDVYGYELRYPAEAEVAEAPKSAFSLPAVESGEELTVDEAYEKYTGKLCIQVRLELGVVTISAPPNTAFAYVACGRTGRAWDGPDRQDELVIDGKTYVAKGCEEQGPGEALAYHNETMVVILEDGTRIEYGSLPSDTATFEDYLRIKPILLGIVQSYHRAG